MEKRIDKDSIRAIKATHVKHQDYQIDAETKEELFKKIEKFFREFIERDWVFKPENDIRTITFDRSESGRIVKWHAKGRIVYLVEPEFDDRECR